MSDNRHHDSTEELEKVNEALVEGERFVEKHLTKILAVATVVVLGVVAVFAYNKLVLEPKGEEALEAMYVAEDHFISGQDSLALVGEGLGIKGFDAIAKEYSSTDAANVAHAYRGIILYEQEKYQEALEALKKFDSKDPLLAPSMERLMGDCLVQLGRLDEAVNTYISAAKRADSDAISPSCLLKAGHVYEKQGKKDKALEIYNQIKKEYYTSQEANNIDADILRASN